ncbi:helix-turn-helix domain-containing protein [Clostridium sp. KNHs205]|jgi:Fic family protein|uniref:helix-turn-helix domain-containing protein n=1 Tax=Clostridium sp. KNHs205 TaxID=1449050 RepID=UPI0009DFCE1F|nr:helix-turn-helix domain-containing protein [Clostridium sp. KNHs205]
MPIQYTKLFQLLSEKNISKTELQKRVGMSSTTMAKLSKNENVSIKIIEDICKTLNCQPGDILEMSNSTDKQLLRVLRDEKEMRLKGGLYHQTQVKLAYNSNRIEGSKLSEDQTRYIYETNTIATAKEETASIDDIMETINHFQCFDYMIDIADERLSEDIIKEFHKILKNNTSDSRKDWFNVGDYKKKPNMIGDQKTISPSKVKGEMAKLLTDYNQIQRVTFEDIIEFHYNFEIIHPFQDGNGRVGRMIIFKECLKNDIVPFIIDEQHKLFYYRGLKEFSVERGYLIDTCFSAQDRYKELLEYFSGE